METSRMSSASCCCLPPLPVCRPLPRPLPLPSPPPQGPQQKAGGGCTSRAVAQPEAKLWVATLVEVLLTALLPLALVLLVLATSKRMPGKPGDDLRLHALAK